jgi:hypothetical protein
VTALIAGHSVQCGWQGRDRCSSQSVKRMLRRRCSRVMPPEVMARGRGSMRDVVTCVPLSVGRTSDKPGQCYEVNRRGAAPELRSSHFIT